MAKDYDSAVSVAAAASSPALRATVDATGIIDPMKSDAAARDYASLVADKKHRAASDNTISDTFKSLIGKPLTGRDPVMMERSFNWYNQLYTQGGLTRDELHRYFPDPTSENHFWGIQGLSQGGRAIKQIAKDLTDNPYDQKVLDDAMVNGHINLAKLSGLPGKPEDIDAQIQKARNAAFLSGAQRSSIFFNADVGTDSNESVVFDALLADQFIIQKRGGAKVDLDASIKAVAGQTGGYLVTPTANGGLQARRDPYNGRGRSLLHPLNADASSPLSIMKGFRPIYAMGAKVTNAMGDVEDTLVTWTEDAKAASKMFPGRIADGDKLHLDRQDNNGLSMVKTETGEMVQFMPGQKVILRTRPNGAAENIQNALSAVLPDVNPKRYGEAVEVPKDPKAATEFFRKNLGPGWEALPIGFNSPDGNGWVLHYAPRVKIGEAERDAMIAARQSRVTQFRQDVRGVTGTTETGGGAALRFNNATGSAAATKDVRADTGNAGPSWPEVAGSVNNAAGAVVDTFGELQEGQIDALKKGWNLVGGSKRLDNASGLFRKADTSLNP